MRNISRTLWPASFRGVAFEVETEAFEDGRRLIVHEFPKGDTPLIEDMGRKARTFPIRAFVPNTLLATRDRLYAACRQTGAGTLVLPLDGPVSVHVQDVAVRHESGRLGYLALDITFVEAGGDAGLLSTRALSGTLAGFLEAGGGIIGPALADAFRLGTTPELAAAGAALGALGPDLDGALGALLRRAASAETGRGEASAATSLLNGLLLAGDPSAEAEAIAAAASDRLADVATILRRGLRRVDAASAGTALSGLLVTEPSGEEPRGTTGQRVRANLRAGRTALASLCAVTLCRVAATADYSDRSSAVTARDSLRDEVGPVAEAAGLVLGASAASLVSDALGTAARVLEQRMTTLAPVVGVQATVSLPSTVIAWALYQDPARGQELAERNGVGTPCLMPTEFEALVE